MGIKEGTCCNEHQVLYGNVDKGMYENDNHLIPKISGCLGTGEEMGG